jgi:hypothetical protein
MPTPNYTGGINKILNPCFRTIILRTHLMVTEKEILAVGAKVVDLYVGF